MPDLTQKPKIIFCDVDKTVTVDDVWYHLTSSLHSDIEEHYQFYTDYLKDKISFNEMKKGLFKIWKSGFGGPIPKRVLEDIFFKVELRGEAFAVFSDLRMKGYKLCILSSYMDLFLKQVAQRLQIDYWFGNSVFVFDEHGHWVDYQYQENEAEYKVTQLEKFIAEHGINPSECLVLGGGYEEIELFKKYPGVAVNSENEVLKSFAWKEIKYLPTVLQLLNQFE